MISLDHVKVVSLVYSKHVHTFRVQTDEGETLVIRLLENALFDEWVNYIQQRQNCFVDLEVQPIDWTIKDLSGTSLFLHDMK